jgi:hypothetical protein
VDDELLSEELGLRNGRRRNEASRCCLCPKPSLSLNSQSEDEERKEERPRFILACAGTRCKTRRNGGPGR